MPTCVPRFTLCLEQRCLHTLYFERMKSYCSTSIKSLDVKARREGNYPASNRMRLWATDFASEASFEKRRHSSQKQQVGGPAHYSSRHIDSVPKATLRRHGKNSCSMAVAQIPEHDHSNHHQNRSTNCHRTTPKNSSSMAGCLLDLFFEHGAFSDLMRIMWYHCRCKSCSEGRQIKTLCKVQESSKTISFLPPLQRPWTLQ